ncbi:hypothetical protein [Occallatibacter riparius]|uniref:Uncharacterized protein n=1 Tax=Occallatibacter riparius TaxID=1002689 RepID=A0A9J7BRR4_9BACT|nr:hypothetical protein [Occallatibacter riparius]UWZ85273.1 hypothetical protein MOP44_04860 [Occallatibacter riparius]
MAGTAFPYGANVIDRAQTPEVAAKKDLDPFGLDPLPDANAPWKRGARPLIGSPTGATNTEISERTIDLKWDF